MNKEKEMAQTPEFDLGCLNMRWLGAYPLKNLGKKRRGLRRIPSRYRRK